MKKIALFSLIACGFSFGALGNSVCGVECNSDNEGKYLACPGVNAAYVRCGSGDWKNITPFDCDTKYSYAPTGYLNIGVSPSGYGSDLLLWVKRGTSKTGNGYLFDEDKLEYVCEACRQGFKWDAGAKKCVNAKESSVRPSCKPGDPTCGQNPRTEQLSKPCDGDKNVNDACVAGNHATKGRCRDLAAKNGGTVQRTCAATECEDGYLLWLDENGISQGICHSEKYAKDNCITKCDNCKPNEECVPWIVDTPSNLKINGQTLVPKKDGAYRECHCVPKDNTGRNDGNGNDNDGCDGKVCKYRFTVDVYCKTTPPKHITASTEISISREEANALKWEELRNKLEKVNQNDKIDEILKAYGEDGNIDSVKMDAFINKVCGAGEPVRYIPVDDNGAEIESAKKTLADFYKKTKDNRNVWRDKDGNFNTARLASDLTAGVVLGTVGGVVSGVVIKKKQVEKGFDALHCTVGGQTIADWGDTFTVGLR